MGAAYAAGYALGKLKTAGDSCALRALRLAVPCGPAIAGREARSRQRRRLNCRDGGGVLIRLLALNTGRGHCRARTLRPPRPGRNGLGAVLNAVIPSPRSATTRHPARRGPWCYWVGQAPCLGRGVTSG